MMSKETKRKGKASFGMLGKHHSEESKRKMSAALKGKPRSEEVKRKISLTHKKLVAHKKGIVSHTIIV